MDARAARPAPDGARSEIVMAPKMGPTIPQHATRESWLVAAAELLRPDVEMAVCEHVTGRLNAEAIPQ